jgi:hypothetical protein
MDYERRELQKNCEDAREEAAAAGKELVANVTRMPSKKAKKSELTTKSSGYVWNRTVRPALGWSKSLSFLNKVRCNLRPTLPDADIEFNRICFRLSEQ